jgi:hypothetical protein
MNPNVLSVLRALLVSVSAMLVQRGCIPQGQESTWVDNVSASLGGVLALAWAYWTWRKNKKVE